MTPKKPKDTKPEEIVEELEVSTSEQAPILNILIKARTKAKKTLPQVSKFLNVQLSYLIALEEGDTDSLPESVYTLGFVRSYANYLKLDGPQCAKEYKEQILYGFKETQNTVAPTPPQESMAPKRAMLFLSFVLVVGGYMGWLYVTEFKDTKYDPLSAVQVAETEDPEEGETLFDVSQPEVEDPFAFEDQPVDKKTAEAQKKRAIQIETSLKPDADKKKLAEGEAMGEDSGIDHSDSEIVIMANQRSWIEIKDAERKILYRGILKEGETYPVPKGEGMVFTTGNAGGIAFSINGKKTPPLGRSGQVIRRVPLTKESLSAVANPNKPQPQTATGDNNRVTTRERDERPTP